MTALSPAQQIALWADKLRDMTVMGLAYTENVYERARYHELQQMAFEMWALATDTSLEQLTPLRESLFFDRPSPILAGEGAVIDRAGRILLIRRADNGRWAMPGGALEVGETPAQGVQREVYEETGVRCEALQLAGIFDARLWHTTSRYHLYLVLFLCRPSAEGRPPDPASHALETLATGWFAEAELPENLDPGHAARLPAAFQAWRGAQAAYFDRA